MSRYLDGYFFLEFNWKSCGCFVFGFRQRSFSYIKQVELFFQLLAVFCEVRCIILLDVRHTFWSIYFVARGKILLQLFVGNLGNSVLLLYGEDWICFLVKFIWQILGNCLSLCLLVFLPLGRLISLLIMDSIYFYFLCRFCIRSGLGSSSPAWPLVFFPLHNYNSRLFLQ